MTPLDAMKAALEELIEVNESLPNTPRALAIYNLRAAIEQMEKVEPVAWVHSRWLSDHSRKVGNVVSETQVSGYAPIYTAPVTPEGWQLVPKKMTDEMRVVALLMLTNCHSVEESYADLLAAAPEYGK